MGSRISLGRDCVLGRDFIHLVKKGGGFYPNCNKTWGDYIHLYENDQGDFFRGILSYTQTLALAIRPAPDK